MNKKDRALKYLIECETLTEASKKAEISRKTLYNYINTDSDFFRAYSDIQRSRRLALADEVTESTRGVFRTLQEIAEDSEVAPKDRVSACRELIFLLKEVCNSEKVTTKEIQDEYLIDPMLGLIPLK